MSHCCLSQMCSWLERCWGTGCWKLRGSVWKHYYVLFPAVAIAKVPCALSPSHVHFADSPFPNGGVWNLSNSSCRKNSIENSLGTSVSPEKHIIPGPSSSAPGLLHAWRGMLRTDSSCLSCPAVCQEPPVNGWALQQSRETCLLVSCNA